MNMLNALNLYQAIQIKALLKHCRVVKQADTPPCLGGGEFGKASNGLTTP